MPGIQFIQHQGRRVLLLDFTGVAETEEALRLMAQARAVVAARPGDDARERRDLLARLVERPDQFNRRSEPRAKAMHVSRWTKAFSFRDGDVRSLLDWSIRCNSYLAAAVEGRASHVVTGDRRFLALGEHAGVEIVTPRAFFDLLGP